MQGVGQATSWSLYQEAAALVESNLLKAAAGEAPSLEAMRGLADELVRAFRESQLDWTRLALAPAHEGLSALAIHPVNVAILTLQLHAGAPEHHEREVDGALISLLHDIGMGAVRELAEAPRALTSDEQMRVRTHVDVTTTLLRSIDGVDPEMIEIIREEHERVDGSGYPQARQHHQLHRAGKLLAAVDVFEARTHHRPHRPAQHPAAVVREFMGPNVTGFDVTALKLLITRLGVYPMGSWVQLSTREIARVIEPRPKTPLRPLVEVVTTRDREPLTQARQLDLATMVGIGIKQWLDEAEVRGYLQREDS